MATRLMFRSFKHKKRKVTNIYIIWQISTCGMETLLFHVTKVWIFHRISNNKEIHKKDSGLFRFIYSKQKSPDTDHTYVNKCVFTFSSEMRQIQWTRAMILVYKKWTRPASQLICHISLAKSKCTFINSIHTGYTTEKQDKLMCSS